MKAMDNIEIVEIINVLKSNKITTIKAIVFLDGMLTYINLNLPKFVEGESLIKTYIIKECKKNLETLYINYKNSILGTTPIEYFIKPNFGLREALAEHFEVPPQNLLLNE